MPNKSLTKAFLLLGISLIALFASSCSMDLEPSWKKGTTLSIELGAATAEQSRALLTQSGFLYICPDSKVLGPYSVSVGTRFATTEVEPGTYSRFIIIYSPNKLSTEALDSALNGSAPFAEAIAANVSGRASWGSLSSVTIKPSTDNLIAMTLVPAVASNLVIDSSSDSYEVAVAPDEGETVVSRFIRIDNPLSSESTVLGLEISLDASTASATLPQANIPTVIPVYTREGKASSVFSFKSYTDGIATYTGPLPAANDTLYISVSFTPDAERSAVHVKLVQKLDKPVEPEYTTYMKISGTGTYLNKRFFAYVHEVTEDMKPDQGPAAYGIAIATGTSVEIGLLNAVTGEVWTPDATQTYMAGFFIDVENFWPDFTDPDIMKYVDSGKFFYGGMLHAMNDASFAGSGAAAALGSFECKNLIALKTVANHMNDGTGKINYQMLNMWGDGTLRIPMPLYLTSAKGRFVEWNTAADGSGTAYKAQSVYTGASDELVLYAQWISETLLPKGIFTVSLTGQSAYAGKQIAALISGKTTENHDPVGFAFGKISTDGTFSGAFTDYVGIPLTALPNEVYSVTLFIDKDALWPELNYFRLFDFSEGALVAFKQADYSTGTAGFSQSFTATDFTTLRTIIAYPNYAGATDDPVEIKYPDGQEFTLAPQMTPFVRTGYTLAGWAKTSNASVPDFTLGSTVTVTQDLVLYAVWKEEVVVPDGIFRARLINANEAVGKTVIGVLLSQADTGSEGKAYTGLFIGTVAADGTYTGSFTDSAGAALESLPAGMYFITLFVDSQGTWPEITDLSTFQLGSGTKTGFLEYDYPGAVGIDALLDYSEFMASYCVTLHPNYEGAADEPETELYGGTTYYTEADTFVRPGYAIAGWSTILGATTVEYALGTSIPVVDGMNLYAVWTVAGEVGFTVTFPSTGDPVITPQTQTVPAGTLVNLAASGDFTHCEWFLDLGYGAREFIGASLTFDYDTKDLAPGVWQIVLHAWDSNNLERTASCWLTIE